MGSTCPICFDDLDGKVKASPSACDHVFCLLCIEKWSKLGSYCPVDRKRYRKIIRLDSDDVIQVKPRKRKRTRIVYDFTTNCDICQKDDSADTLLLCDCCDLGFHCQCLSPPLTVIPAGLWFCPTCVTIEEKLKKKKGITKEVEAEIGVDYKSLAEKEGEKPVTAKCNKAGTSSSKQSTNVMIALQDIMSVFQTMDYEKEWGKDNFNISSNRISKNKPDKTLNSFSSASNANENIPQNESFKKYDLNRNNKMTSDSENDEMCKTLTNTKKSVKENNNFNISNSDNVDTTSTFSNKNKESSLNESQVAISQKDATKLPHTKQGQSCEIRTEKSDKLIDTHRRDLQDTSLKNLDEFTKEKEKTTDVQPEVQEKSSEAKSSSTTLPKLIRETNMSKGITLTSMAKCSKLRRLKPVVRLERLSILNFLNSNSKETESDRSKQSNLEGVQTSNNFNCHVRLEKIGIQDFLGIGSNKFDHYNNTNNLEESAIESSGDNLCSVDSYSDSPESYDERDDESDEYASSNYDLQMSHTSEGLSQKESNRTHKNNIKMKFCVSCNDIIFASKINYSLCRICKTSSLESHNSIDSTVKNFGDNFNSKKHCTNYDPVDSTEKYGRFKSVGCQTEISCMKANCRTILRTFIASENHPKNITNKSFYFSDLKEHLKIRSDGTFYLDSY